MTVGDYIIVNDVDRPDSKHIAIVTHVRPNGNVDAEYLNIEWEKMTNIERGTLVSDFGRDVVRDNTGETPYSVIAVPNGNASVATYRDGKHRPWQE